MILKRDEWLFFSTMKCATNSMYEYLQKPELGGVWCGGKEFHGRPRERMAPIHWTIHRNPFDRAVSIWASAVVREENRLRYGAAEDMAKMGLNPDNFSDFAYWLSDGCGWAMRNPFLFADQSSWLRDIPVDMVMPLENLKDNLGAVLGDKYIAAGPLPVKNTSIHNVRMVYYVDPEATRNITAWAASDFELFGYDTDPSVRVGPTGVTYPGERDILA